MELAAIIAIFNTVGHTEGSNSRPFDPKPNALNHSATCFIDLFCIDKTKGKNSSMIPLPLSETTVSGKTFV